MKQQTLAVAADQTFESYRKPTRRDEFLKTMEAIVPWTALCDVIEPHYPKAGNGRPPIGLERMLRIHFLQHWFMTIHFDGKDMEVEELSIRLPFGRKPATMSEIAGSEDCNVYITETREMEPAEFDNFAKNLLKSRDWLKGKGGYYGDGRLCVEVHAPGRPYLFIDPSGSDYGRYVAAIFM